MDSILITIRSGVAELVASSKQTSVEIIDLDALREGAYDDVKEYWRNGLSARARRYVEAKHPQIAISAKS